jgi:hypothetical protein
MVFPPHLSSSQGLWKTTGVIKQNQAKNVRSHGRLELGFSSQREGSRLLTQYRKGFDFLLILGGRIIW